MFDPRAVDRIADDSSPSDVIPHGGEAAVRDRTTAGAFDVVDRNSPGAESVLDFVDDMLSALRTVSRRAIVCA